MSLGKFILFFSILSLSSAKLAAAETSINFVTPNHIQYVEKILPALMKKYNVPGVSVAAIKQSQIVWSQGFGVTSVNSNLAVTNDTVFEACSLSKPVFAYFVMQLVQQGKLALDKPLVEYIGQSYIVGDEQHKSITARMVLSHSTGFPNWRQISANGGFNERHRWLDKKLNVGRPLNLIFKPGTQQGYSGEGFLMLQIVIERILNDSLSNLIDNELFNVLKLKRTAFRWRPKFNNDMAIGHDAEGQPLIKPFFQYDNAAYSLYTSAREYAKLTIELMSLNRSSKHSIKQNYVEQMLVNQAIADGKSDYGLGWYIKSVDGHKLVKHSGFNSGYRAFVFFFPESKQGWVIMTNSENGIELITELTESLEEV